MKLIDFNCPTYNVCYIRINNKRVHVKYDSIELVPLLFDIFFNDVIIDRIFIEVYFAIS